MILTRNLLQRLDSAFLLIRIMAFLSYMGITANLILKILKNILSIKDEKPLVYPLMLLIFSISIIFNSYYEEDMPVRKVGISLSKLEKNDHIQLNLFDNIKEIDNKTNLNNIVDEINEKYGSNSILKATSLLSTSTIKDRNNKIGGHNAR